MEKYLLATESGKFFNPLVRQWHVPSENLKDEAVLYATESKYLEVLQEQRYSLLKRLYAQYSGKKADELCPYIYRVGEDGSLTKLNGDKDYPSFDIFFTVYSLSLNAYPTWVEGTGRHDLRLYHMPNQMTLCDKPSEAYELLEEVTELFGNMEGYRVAEVKIKSYEDLGYYELASLERVLPISIDNYQL